MGESLTAKIKNQSTAFSVKDIMHACSEDGGLDGKLLLSKGKRNLHLDLSHCHALT